MVAGGITGSNTPDYKFTSKHHKPSLDTATIDNDINPDDLDVFPVDKLGKDVEIDDSLAHNALKPTWSDAIHHVPFLIIACITAGLGGFLFGFDTGVINGVQISTGFGNTMGKNTLTAAGWANRTSWITSSLTLAAAFGCMYSRICQHNFQQYI